MLAKALCDLYGYNHWATERVLDAAAKLMPEEWLAPGNAGRGSIRDTLVHMISAQKRWLAWWDGSLTPERAYSTVLDLADYPDVESVRGIWTESDQAMRAFAEALSD